MSIVDGHISMFEVDKLSSFFTKLSKNNVGASWGASDAPDTPTMGASWGESDTPCDAPMLFFSKNKKLSFQSNAHHHPTHSPSHHPPTHNTTTSPTTTTHPTSNHPNTTHPPTTQKIRALMPDISWAPPHSLPIQ